MIQTSHSFCTPMLHTVWAVGCDVRHHGRWLRTPSWICFQNYECGRELLLGGQRRCCSDLQPEEVSQVSVWQAVHHCDWSQTPSNLVWWGEAGSCHSFSKNPEVGTHLESLWQHNAVPTWQRVHECQLFLKAATAYYRSCWSWRQSPDYWRDGKLFSAFSWEDQWVD